jgi:hypothetical protein
MKTTIDRSSHLFINTNLLRVISQDMFAFLNLKLILYSVYIHILSCYIHWISLQEVVAQFVKFTDD